MNCGLSVDSLYQINEVPFYSWCEHFCLVFKGCWILSSTFSVSFEIMFVVLLFVLLMLYYIDFSFFLSFLIQLSFSGMWDLPG